MKQTDPEDKDVFIKMSSCNLCNGTVRFAVKHLMTVKSTNSFLKEVMEYNLKVSEVPLIEYRNTDYEWCVCGTITI